MDLRSGGIIAREIELRALERALAGSWAGQGPPVVVAGRAGVGKSVLVSAGLRAARVGTALVGRCVPPPAAPLRPLAELALAAVRAGADPTAPGLRLFGTALDRLLGREAPSAPDGAGGEGLALASGEALLRLARSLPPPVAYVVEDLHWADHETLATFEHLVDHGPAERVAVVATLRDDEGVSSGTLVDRLAERRALQVLRLRPLAAEELETMVAACLGGAPPPALVEEIADRTEGVPLLVEEWLSTAADVGRLRRAGGSWVLAPGQVPVPASFAGAVARRLAALDQGHRDVLEVAALIARDLDASLLVTATGVPEATVATALRAAWEAGLVESAPGDGLRFRHALTRDAVRAARLPPERALAARAALDRLEQVSPTAAVLDARAALAEEAGDPVRRARSLLAAGQAAVRAGALVTARARLEACVAIADEAGGDVAIEAAVAHTAVLAQVGEADAALASGATALTRLELAGATARMGDMYLAMARAAANAERFEEAAALLAGPHAPSGVEADALAALVAMGLGRHRDAESAARRALASGGATPSKVAASAACEALEVLGRLARRRDLDEAEQWFRRGVLTAGREGLLLWRARALHELATVRQLSDGEVDGLVAAREAAVEAGALSLVVGIDFHLSAVHGVRFEVDAALASGRSGLDLARRLGAPRLEAMAWVVIGQAHAAAARRTEAEAAGREALALAGDDPEVRGLVDGACRALSSLLLDDVDGALTPLRTAITSLRRLDGKTPVSPWYLWPLLATVHAPEPEGARARAETDTLELRVMTGFDALWHLADAAACGTRGDVREARAAAARSEAAFVRVPGLAGYRALAHRLVAEAALAGGWGDPAGWLAQAESWFRAHALEDPARACRSLLRLAGVPQRRRGRGDAIVPDRLAALGVTSRELDVLALVAEGLGNREIAARLYVSTRTVKTHLEHLRTKTGLASRVELAGLARVHDVAPKSAAGPTTGAP